MPKLHHPSRKTKALPRVQSGSHKMIMVYYLKLFTRVFCCTMICFFVFITTVLADVTLCTWNLKDFGSSKNDEEIKFIANTIKHYDIIAIQEVVAGDGGAEAVARLSDQLNRMGIKWDYVVSDPTSGNSYKRERYAFVWKSNRVQKIGHAWLEKKYEAEIDREPFFIIVKVEGKMITLSNFHAITKSMNPETEIKYFKFLPEQYSDQNIIFCGDFNLPQSHTVFNPLKKLDYKPVIEQQKTSLKQKCINNDCLASEFDNIFYQSQKIKFSGAKVIHFYKEFSSLSDALKISDHVPVIFRFSIF